jgi:hypothetical protein
MIARHRLMRNLGETAPETVRYGYRGAQIDKDADNDQVAGSDTTRKSLASRLAACLRRRGALDERY